LDSVIDDEMHPASAEIQEGSVTLGKPEIFSVSTVLATPNPMRQGQAIHFMAEGTGIKETRVTVFTLHGQRVYDEQKPSHRLLWNLQDAHHRPISNGVYLYVVQVKGLDGQRLVTRVQKLVIAR
jgi:hypothetical protein